MTSPIRPKTILVYQGQNGKEPFTDWLGSLQDKKTRQIILRRVGKMELGHYGDCDSVGDGVRELRLFFGPGYRIYFSEEGNNIVILLTGGSKNTQSRDIINAKAYWKEYQNRA